MKKILIFMLALIMLSGIVCHGAAVSSDMTSGVPAGWISSAEYGGSITDTTREGEKAVSLQGSGEMPVMNVSTEAVDFSLAETVFISTVFESDISDGSGAVQYFRLAWGSMNEGTAEPPIRQSIILGEISSNSSLMVCGNSQNLESGKHILAFAISPLSNGVHATAYLDGELLAEGDITDDKISPDFTTLRFNWHCWYYTADTSLYADLNIYRFNMTDADEIAVTSDPEDGNALAIVPAEGIEIDFNTILKAVPENITVNKSEDSEIWEAVTAETVFTGSSMTVIPETVEENVYYKVAFENVQALSGDTEEGCEITFKTAIEGYIPPEVTITSPADGAHFRSGDSVTVSADASSENGIEKTEYFINGELLGEGDEVIWTAPKVSGNYIIEAKATDSHGGIAKQQITIVIDKNKLPEISFEGIEDDMDTDALESLTVNASDADGSVKEIRLYMNGKLIGKRQSSGSFDVSGIYGAVTFKAVAYDNDGGVNENSIYVIIKATGLPYAIDTEITGEKTVTINFSEPWKKNGSTLSDIKEYAVVECETGKAEIESFTNTSGNTYTLEMKNPLDGGCNYNIKIQTEDKCSNTAFKPDYKEVDVTNAVITAVNETEAVLTVANSSGSNKTVIAVLVTMNASGKIRETKTEEIIIPAGKTVNAVVSARKADKAIAYIIDSEDSGKGMINKIFTLE